MASLRRSWAAEGIAILWMCSLLLAPAAQADPANPLLVAGYVQRVLALIEAHYLYPTDRPTLLGAAALHMRAAEPWIQGNASGAPPAAWPEFAAWFEALAARRPDRTGALGEAAIEGLVEGLQDPYSMFLDAGDRRQFEAEVHGASFPGIGVELGMKEGRLIVVAALDAAPAARAGVRAGDWIAAVDGRPTAGLSLGQAAALLEGGTGRPVTLTLERGGSQRTVRIVRKVLALAPVTVRLWSDGSALMRISYFGPDTRDQAATGLAKLGRRAKGLVIDLRDNPGGDFTAALRTSRLFVTGKVLIFVQGRTGPPKPFVGAPGPVFGKPVVVLVNQGTASAAEVMSAALAGNGAAVLAGQPTFGKALIQTVYGLTGRTALKLTTDRYLTPGGQDITGRGLTPGILLPAQPEAPGDPVLKQALQELRRRL